MAKRAIKYNPAFLTDEELTSSFVVRHTDLDLVLQVLRENTTAANQHVLVVGPRGIGKTTLVLRVAAEIRRNKELNERWYPLVFGEESYEVSSPGEFWLEALFHLGQKTEDHRWRDVYQELIQVQDEAQLRERALAQLMDFADAQHKRILLIVENLNMLVGDQISDDEAWVLRHTLTNECRVMMLATATSRLDHEGDNGKALFEAFKVHELKPLNDHDCQALWGSRTGHEPALQRVRPIQILTGGNPRLLTIISSFGATLSLKRLMDDLMQLVDDHTDYFKSHLDCLPPIERKAYLALADLWDPATANQVAGKARLDVSKTSALLNRLVGRGAVLVATARGRTKTYQVAERMYNIYYLMRRRGSPSRRVRALVNFMVSFYEPEDLVQATELIVSEACQLAPPARETHYLLWEGICREVPDDSVRRKIIDAAPRAFLEAETVPESLKELTKRSRDSEGDLVVKERQEPMVALSALMEQADEAALNPELSETAESLYLRATNLFPLSPRAWEGLGFFLFQVATRYEEAEAAYRKAIELDPKYAWTWAHLGQLLHQRLGRYEEAEAAYRKAVELDAKYAWAWGHLGQLLHERLGRYEEAEAMYRRAIELDPGVSWAWAQLGQLLHESLGRYEEAEAAYRKAMGLDPNYAWVWVQLGQLLHESLGRHEEAEATYRKAVELDPKYTWAFAHLGQLLHECLGRYEEAEVAYRKAIGLNPEYPWTWAQLGRLLHEHLGRSDEAEAAYREAIRLAPEVAWGWGHLGKFLHGSPGRHEEAEEAYRKAIELNPKYAWGWAQLGQLLHEHLGRYDEAEAAYREAIRLAPEVAWGWSQLGQLLHEHLGRYGEAEDAYLRLLQIDPGRSDAWRGLLRLAKDGKGSRDLLLLTREIIDTSSTDASVLNNLAWTFFKEGDRSILFQAAEWARKAVELAPGNCQHQHTLACILVALGQGREAMEHATRSLLDPSVMRESLDEWIGLFVDLAASGYAREALEALRGSASAGLLEPLSVGLALFLGEDVKAAAEILEVGRDVRSRIEDRVLFLQTHRRRMTYMIHCGECDAILDESPNVPRKDKMPCPKCGSLKRVVDVHVEEVAGAQDHVAASVSREGQVSGFRESSRDGLASSADLNQDGSLAYSLNGASPQGEQDTVAACSVLIQHLNSLGSNWSDPNSGQGSVDCESVDRNDPRKRLSIQVVRAIADEGLWRRLGRLKHASVPEAPASEISQQMRDAIEKKLSVIPAPRRKSLLLLLDATRLPALGFDAVVSDFLVCHGRWARGTGFSEIWLVLPPPLECHRLDCENR